VILVEAGAPHPLTQMRSKPAVPIVEIASIDIPISNVLTRGSIVLRLYTIQLVSLHPTSQIPMILTRSIRLGAIWAAEQTISADWYQVRLMRCVSKHLRYYLSGAKCVDLAGDHLYRMDYKAMAEYHWATKLMLRWRSAVPREKCFYLKREADGRISSFVEKPKT
jgi:ADP-glucose pyrophosphorylase